MRLRSRESRSPSVVSLRISRKVVRQLRNVAGDASSLIHGEDMGYVGVSLGFSAIDVGERLPVGVLHLNWFDRPGWWEATVPFIELAAIRHRSFQ